ncbi:hypothetical protein OQA88_12785 [Cercophora sp. LCS_1]
MTSSGSSKDLNKALSAFFQAPSLPLPSELVAVITAYLDKHARSDESAAERLNDELISIYEKSVHGRTERYAPFLAVLRELRPALRTPPRIFEWWNKLLDPVLEVVDREKGLAREVLDHTLDLLSINENDDPAAWNEAGLAPFIGRLLDRWMGVKATQASTQSSFANLKERMVRETLVIFGKKDPKGFMVALNGFMLKKETRNNSLSLFCDFIASQPPHLHLILQTPLFVSILHSLQKDESTETVNMSVLSLIMILPYMPGSLVPYLPTLFNIYARLLFWDRDSYFAQEHTEFETENEDGTTWDKCLLDPDHDGRTIHYLPVYFTMLYGLYPLNFVDYIRKPQRYLRHANNDEDIDVQAMEIRDRSERFREIHRLHPNFYNLTIESEKTDLSRWLRSDPDEVLAVCMALRINTPPEPQPAEVELEIPRPTEVALTDEGDEEAGDCPLLSSSAFVDTPSLRNSSSINLVQQAAPPEITASGGDSIRSTRSQSSHPSGHDLLEMKTREAGGDSPTLPPHLIPSSSHTHLQDMINSNKAIKSGLNQSSGNDSVPSLSLTPQDSIDRVSLRPRRSQHLRPAEKADGGQSDHTALLYHQSLLLLNDLQFERYIKQQHITHMGALRRKQIKEAATEAEAQNLVMANRSLKQRLDEAKRQESQIKKEFDHRRTMAQKRENDLSNKLRALREEQKKWSAEGTMLKQQLDKAQAECKALRKMVDAAEEKRLEMEQNLESADLTADEIERLKAEILRLSEVEHEYQGKQLKLEQAQKAAEAAEIRAEQWKLELTARENELQQARSSFEAQTASLGNRLSEALRENPGGRTSEVTAVFEAALAASRTKQAELQKQYSSLMRKYTVLQSSVLDMECDASERRRGNDSGAAADTELMGPVAGSPIAIRNRTHRGFSDPESPEGFSHNATSPLEPISTSLGANGGPSTPADVDKTGTSTSPQMERYFGRGGVQNAIRKERKDKKDDKDKKDKKSGTGLRGIRNFV